MQKQVKRKKKQVKKLKKKRQKLLKQIKRKRKQVKKLKESSLLVNTWYEKGGFRERSEDLMLRVSSALMALKGMNVKGKRKPGCNAYIDKVLNLEIEQATQMLDAVIDAKTESKDAPPGEP